MNKRKIVLLAMSLCMVAILAVGGTLAYFTDTDAQVNTFTVGNVAIDLYEDFGDNDEGGVEKLIPATGSAQDDTLKNGIEKEVYVMNTGTEEAYVRVHIAIPTLLDNGDPTFDASANIVHFNFDPATVGEGKWDWSKSNEDGKYTGNWNFYTTTIDGIGYNVYVVTYTGILGVQDSTCDAMHQVYMDPSVTNEDITKLKETLGNTWKIYVGAEGGQVAGFANAYEALNTQFGVPGEYNFAWDQIATGATWVEAE